MDQLSPLIPIEQYAFTKTFSLNILSYYLHPYFFGLPCALLTCPNLIRSTRRTGASIGLRRTMLNYLGDFLFYRGYAYLSTNILISHLISPRVSTHPTKHVHLCYTHLLSMISLYNPTFCTNNKAGLIAVR